jgi:hypothetical protein
MAALKPFRLLPRGDAVRLQDHEICFRNITFELVFHREHSSGSLGNSELVVVGTQQYSIVVKLLCAWRL